VGHWNFDSYIATTGIWPSPDVGDDFRTEVACDIPVVFAQGDWDTSTPVENLLQVTPYVRKSRVLLLERGGHGALGVLMRQTRSEVPAALLEFLKTGSTEGLPVRVTLPLPQFAVPDFPPAAPKQHACKPRHRASPRAAASAIVTVPVARLHPH
jgi:hypothetical protein